MHATQQPRVHVGFVPVTCALLRCRAIHGTPSAATGHVCACVPCTSRGMCVCVYPARRRACVCVCVYPARHGTCVCVCPARHGACVCVCNLHVTGHVCVCVCTPHVTGRVCMCTLSVSTQAVHDREGRCPTGGGESLFLAPGPECRPSNRRPQGTAEGSTRSSPWTGPGSRTHTVFSFSLVFLELRPSVQHSNQHAQELL